MCDGDESGIVDLDRLERIFWWAAGVCWVLVAVIVLGEVQGWWNDAGEVAGMVTTIFAGLLTVIALLINATKAQARSVRRGVSGNGRRLGMIHEGIRILHEDNDALQQGQARMHQGLERLHQDNERQTEILVQIRDRL